MWRSQKTALRKNYLKSGRKTPLYSVAVESVPICPFSNNTRTYQKVRVSLLVLWLFHKYLSLTYILMKYFLLMIFICLAICQTSQYLKHLQHLNIYLHLHNMFSLPWGQWTPKCSNVLLLRYLSTQHDTRSFLELKQRTQISLINCVRDVQ